jgi:cephalosporin hydroxylase
MTDHVRKELELYGPLVSPGCYLIVNDTYFEEWGKYGRDENPAKAVREFVAANKAFEIDPALPRFNDTCAPSGYLRRLDGEAP